METDVKSIIEEKQIPEGFIKVTEQPVCTLTSEQKAILNRKGNVFFNQNNVEQARRIFLATGYSDGLTRVGDYYMEHNEPLKALKQYMLAHNERKLEPIYSKISNVISKVLLDD